MPGRQTASVLVGDGGGFRGVTRLPDSRLGDMRQAEQRARAHAHAARDPDFKKQWQELAAAWDLLLSGGRPGVNQTNATIAPKVA